MPKYYYNNYYRRRYWRNYYRYRKKFKRYKQPSRNSNSTYLKLDGQFDIGYTTTYAGLSFITNEGYLSKALTMARLFQKITIWQTVSNLYNMMSIKGIKIKISYNCNNQNCKPSVMVAFNAYVNGMTENEILDANDKYIYNGLTNSNKSYYKNVGNCNIIGYKQPQPINQKDNITGVIGIKESGMDTATQQSNIRIFTLTYTLYIRFFNSKN